ncbi:MAG: SusC/RagA family TonB-linked outer membrane protein, partial [Flavisolibacter sp.]|nr:SusC/RagA family TonB-linked outer membrane protein [Flavisolibacter sp.]
TRGSNGVILITTKRGSSGKPVVRYNGYYGLENLAHVLEPLSPTEYVQKYADYLKQRGQTQTTVLGNAFEIANYNAGKTVDWLDVVTQQGTIQDHNLSVSGGSKDMKYFVSGEYLNQKGVVKGYQYKRVSVRSNLDINVTDFLTIGTSLFFAENNYDGGTDRANFYLAAAMSPYGTLYNASGNYEIYPMYPELLYTNPLLPLYNKRIDRAQNLNGNAYAELKPGFLRGLKYRLNAGYNTLPTRVGTYSGRSANDLLGTATITNNRSKSWIIENILTYNYTHDKHKIDFTGLYSAQENDFFNSGATSTGFINDQLSYYSLGAGATQTGSTSRTRKTLVSQMGRINYSYASRYLLTLTGRRDGSSVFGANTSKYGFFPSLGFGWNISNENFMESVAFINNLKIRGSYGKTGNEAIPINRTATTAGTVRIPFNGVSTIGVLANNLGNTNLTWETTIGTNIGLDFALLRNRITGSIDAYKTRTTDLLLLRNIPNISGYNNIWDNLGELQNKGIEITLNTVNMTSGDFKWESTINFSAYRNKIIDLYGDKKSDIGNRWFIGYPIRVIYDYQLLGVWQEGESTKGWDWGARPGDLKFANINGDTVVNASDRTILGTPLPKWIGGLTNTFHYKNFHLNIFIQTFQGALRNNVNLTFADEAGRMNTPKDIGYWTAENKSNTRPSLNYTNTRGYGYPSDNSYTRIKDITLSYVLPQKILDRLKLGTANLYVSGRNLHTFTNWLGWDPENDFSFRGSGDWTNNYPLTRSVVFGANLTLR